jgi:hypothetical protein
MVVPIQLEQPIQIRENFEKKMLSVLDMTIFVIV